MGLISFFKEKLKMFNKSKALNPAEEQKVVNGEYLNSSSTSRNAQKNVDAKDPFQKVTVDVAYPIKGSTDFAIEQYMLAMQFNYNQSNGSKISPYNAIISLSALDNTYEGNNVANQAAFVNKARNGIYSRKMQENIQRGRNSEPVFYHYSTKGFNQKYDSRIYLNCKQENVALLADELATELGDSDYYFKFGAAESKSRRSEQFVFYVNDKRDPEEIARIINSIERIKQKNPKLLEGAENMNPFMKQYGGIIAYAPEIKDPNFVGLDNKTKTIDPSYNTLLSTALNEATLSAMQNICATKYDLAMQTQGMKIDDISGFLATGAVSKVLQNPEYLKEFIGTVKGNLIQLSMNNPQLDIKGIPNRNEQMKKIEEAKKGR